MAGWPPIVDTIFKKIDRAAVFVPDLTFVGSRLDGRRTPNPNVLIEYGWALRSLGHGRIVPVMNSAFGHPTQDAMPFNLRHLRNPILYDCPPDADDDRRKQAREDLASQLEHALRAVLDDEHLKASLAPATVPNPFLGRFSEDGPGKFRKAGEPLGVHDHRSHDKNIYLSDNPAIWLRVMPTTETERRWLVSDLKGAATANDTMLFPITRQLWRGFDYLRSADGFGVYAVPTFANDRTGAVAFAFTTGEIWCVDSFLLDETVHNGEKIVPNIEEWLVSALKQYSGFLLKLGCNPPFKWIAGMEDLKNRSLYNSPDFWSPHFGPKCLENIIVADGLYSPDAVARDSLKPFFTRLFDACGAIWTP